MASVVLLIVAGALFYYRHYSARVEKEKADLITSIGITKVQQLLAWRADRTERVKSLLKSPILATYMRRLAEAPGDKGNLELLRRRLEDFIKYNHYAGALFLDDSGRVLLRAGHAPEKDCPELGRLLKEPAVLTEPRLSEIHRYHPGGSGMHVLALAAAASSGRKLYFAATLKLEENFYPLVQRWPIASRSGEVLLVTRTDGEIVFLNELRHRKGAALSLRLPADAEDLPAAMALKGRKGVYRGVDYRGVPVLAYVSQLEGSSWGLVSKMDEEEVYAEARRGAALLAGLVLALLAATGAFFYGILTRQKIAAEEREQRFLSALTDSGDTLVVFDLETREMIEGGGACAKMYGYSLEEFRRLKAEDLVPTEAAEALKARFSRIAETAGSLIYETEHRRKNGEVFPVEVSARRMELEGRTCLHGVLRDITARRMVREQRRLNALRAEALLRLAQLQSGGEAGLLDAALAEALKLTGSAIGYIYSYSEEKRLFTLNTWSRDVMKSCAVTAKQTVYALDKTGIWGEVVRQRRGMIVNDYAAPNPHKKGCPEGHSPLVRWLSVPVFSEGRIVAVLGLANKPKPYAEEELTLADSFMEGVWRLLEARRAEARVREAETLVDAAAANLPGAIYRCLYDENWTMEYLSPGVGELTGYRPEEFLSGKVSYASLVAEEDRENLRAEIAAAASKGEPFRCTYRLRRADGRRIWVWEQGRPAPQCADGIRRLDGYITDISPIKAAELEKDRLNAALIEKNREMENFLYITTHDLRTPLVNIQGFSQNVRDYFKEIGELLGEGAGGAERIKKLTDKKIPEALAFVQEGAGKMEALISALLKVSRAGRVELKPEKTGLEPLLRKITDAMRFQMQEAGAEVVVSPGLPPCFADPGAVSRIFSNLLDNALKYRDLSRPLRVRISAEKKNDSVVYSVEDNGRGISGRELKNIWIVFARPLSARERGEGIGLPMVKRIAERSGGGITAESKEGNGSVFRVELPAA